VLASMLFVRSTAANCMGQIEGPFANQIGTIMLFSSRGGGARHQSVPSEFWAVTGRYDTAASHVYPVRFTDEISREIDLWEWGHLAFTPRSLQFSWTPSLKASIFGSP
jgi:hypothetical protein